jgi:hypothetical protein
MEHIEHQVRPTLPYSGGLIATLPAECGGGGPAISRYPEGATEATGRRKVHQDAHCSLYLFPPDDPRDAPVLIVHGERVTSSLGIHATCLHLHTEL